nr:hypothetical protein [uncultured Methanospirillum sp.]
MIKFTNICVGIIVCILLISGTVYGQGVQNTQSSDPTSKTDVATIYKNPLPFLNKDLTLIGVVAVSFPDSHTFMFTDLVGCGSGCGSKCTVNFIPVSYSGAIPKVKDIVQISGTLVKDKENKVLFNATSIAAQ